MEADILGRVYEYLLRKFAEGQGQRRRILYPREVTRLMAYILDPNPVMRLRSGLWLRRSLIKSVLAYRSIRDGYQIAPVKIYGQEINFTTFAMAKMNISSMI